MLNWQSRDGAAAEASCQHRESSVLTPQHQHHQEATLTDASQIYRICSSCPQRLLPTQGSKTERTVTPFGSFAMRQHSVKPLYSYYDSRCRLETAPFCMSASCDMPFDKMAADIRQKGKPVAGANGNFRLELCLSDDRQFCALQLFRFGTPVSLLFNRNNTNNDHLSPKRLTTCLMGQAKYYTSYDQMVYFCLPIAEMDYYDLQPTPPEFLHFDLMAGEVTNYGNPYNGAPGH